MRPFKAAILSLAFSSSLYTISFAEQAEPFTLKVTGIEHKRAIPERFAYCVPDGKGATKDGNNISPEIRWSGAPEGTRSFALLVVDKDVPATFEKANKKDEWIEEAAPRQNFYHWVLIDIPANMVGFPEGRGSNGITPGGKFVGRTDYGVNGQNDYTKVFGGYGESGWGAYDGPCPPWNDMRMHNYHFTLYALDVDSLGLKGTFVGSQVEEVMQKHIIAKAEIVGTYTTNPRLMVR